MALLPIFKEDIEDLHRNEGPAQTVPNTITQSKLRGMSPAQLQATHSALGDVGDNLAQRISDETEQLKYIDNNVERMAQSAVRVPDLDLPSVGDAERTLSHTLSDVQTPDTAKMKEAIGASRTQRKPSTLENFMRLKGGIAKTRIASRIAHMRQLLKTVNGLRSFVQTLIGG